MLMLTLSTVAAVSREGLAPIVRAYSRLILVTSVSREGLAPIVKAYSRLIPVDGLVL